MSSLTSPAGAIQLGMDTSKNTIVVAILMPGHQVPVIDRLWNEEGSVRHLVGRFAGRGALRACYEAGSERASKASQPNTRSSTR
jgi:hypothetical protein